ncbi:MAG: hypothetical protein QG597_1292 [Actinomycetota bacterium]|nr:hypothetical protein [Actinomycetota bacterium]
MSNDLLDEACALVLIDLQAGILALPTFTPSAVIVDRAARLADAFRSTGRPVVLVHVAWSVDGGDLPPLRVNRPGSQVAPPPEFSVLAPQLGPVAGDIVITKRQWGAFTGTELDLQLRRRGVTQIVLAGISTSAGVESTARAAWENGYGLLVVEDACTDVDAASHTHSMTKIFPRLGYVVTTEEVLNAADQRS